MFLKAKRMIGESQEKRGSISQSLAPLTPIARYGQRSIMGPPDHLYVGTSSWSSQDWLGSFYPKDLKPGQLIQYYATQFRAVELDSTFYSIPSKTVVSAWREKTPPGFIFAAKVPSVITHQKVLKDCQKEFTSFLSALGVLEERLGPLLLQFPYFNRQKVQGAWILPPKARTLARTTIRAINGPRREIRAGSQKSSIQY